MAKVKSSGIVDVELTCGELELIRRSMEARGWSPAVAEQCAAAWLTSTIQVAFGGRRG
ncbi:hypothetical protein [Streptomyces tsukubensis]|uniref:hypothetical protein n=1 Tax=Streptomyces tsukubensis TaxID=83656 RepID=UPI00344EB6CB